MVRVGFILNQASFSNEIVNRLAQEPLIRCLFFVTDPKEAFLSIKEHAPTIILMDFELPGSPDLLAQIKDRFPEVSVIVLSECLDRECIVDAFKIGASGYLHKGSNYPEVIRSISEVQAGGVPLSGGAARSLVDFYRKASQPTFSRQTLPQPRISSRERDVLNYLCEGMSNKQIATNLGISYETVCVHLKRIYEKFEVRSRTEAVLKHLQSRSLERGSIRPDFSHRQKPQDFAISAE